MSVSQRKLDALRALAERPGTPAEGEAARAALVRLESNAVSGSTGPDAEAEAWRYFEEYLRSKDRDDLNRALDASARSAQTGGSGLRNASRLHRALVHAQRADRPTSARPERSEDGRGSNL